jgi:hypothetical protein
MRRIGVEIDLGKLKCHDEADKAGNSEPYLWSVFFKIDGTTCVLTDKLFLRGTAVIKTSSGNHGNLVGGGGMDAGDVVRIPSALGHWKTGLVPIPSVDAPKLKVGGVLGCIVVVLEEDETPNAAVAQGHQALNQAMQRELNALIPTFGIEKSAPSIQDIDQLAAKIKQAIRSAIESKVGVGDWFTGLFGGGQDDVIGTFKGIWSHADIQDSIGKAPIDIYDVGSADPLQKLFGGGFRLAEEDGVYRLIGGSIKAKSISLKLGPTAPSGPKKPKDPDLEEENPHTFDHKKVKEGPSPNN